MNKIKVSLLFGCIGLMLLPLLVTCLQAVPMLNTNESTSTAPVPTSDIFSGAGEVISISPVLIEDYLPNPGIGWQYGPGVDDFLYLPETVAYSQRKLLAWKNLNPDEGIYDWTMLDEQLSHAIANGKQFSFRIYTMRGEGYDEHYVPNWVLEQGATLLYSGEPDYSNCTYQEKWGKFVTELANRYDGNPDIAFIDISGYGNFNEWSWQDAQTTWDELWEQNYSNGTTTPATMLTVDSQARRRLADMFIGGSFNSHNCRDEVGDVRSISYAYKGFQKTQLVMPYAGIVQSTQYVFAHRSDVGFRYDCLGRNSSSVLEEVGNEIFSIWKTNPIVFELCEPAQVDLDDAKHLLQMAHGSIVHDNGWDLSTDQLEDMMLLVGYRYYLERASIGQEGEAFVLQMKWQNLGYAPNYPKMGQELVMYFYLLNSHGIPVLSVPVAADISTWLPSSAQAGEGIGYEVSMEIQIPFNLPKGEYLVGVSILEERTGIPINLAFSGRNENGIHILSKMEID